MPALDQWEARIKPYFAIPLRMRILGEVGLSRGDVEDIAAGFHACIQRNLIGNATHIIARNYPFTFLAFLSGYAAHNTFRDYWHSLAELLGVPSHNNLYNHRWHRKFIEGVKQLGLRYFDFEDTNNPYVTTIRFHGGIPTYSLPDYFEHMLLPSIQRSELREADSEPVLQTLIETVNFVDSPVINFFEFSDSFGVDFFDSCRTMARHYLTSKGEVLDAAQLELPEYVVEAFATFMERSLDAEFHLRKPILVIAPYNDEAYLWVKLPEEEIPLHYAEGGLEWQVDWDGLSQPEIRPCRLQRRRQAILSEAAVLPIAAAPRQVSVALVRRPNQEPSDPEVLRSWTLPVLPPEDRAPLLAFRASDGTQLRTGHSLPESVLILVYPNAAILKTEGGGRLHETFGALTGAWEGWQMQAWDLNDAWAVNVKVNGQDSSFSVPIVGRIPDPELTGGNLFQYSDDPSEPPLYLGLPPSVKIPLGAGERLVGWKVSARSVWDTFPIVERTVVLDSQGLTVHVENGAAHLDLSGLLGEQPVGTYELRVFGPGGVEFELRLRCWPKLDIDGLPGAKFEGPQTVRDVKFHLRLPEGAECEAQAGAGDVQVARIESGWQVQVGPESTCAALNLVWKTRTGTLLRVPLAVPISRLRWALALEQNEGNLAWTGRMLNRSVDALLQSQFSAIHVEMYGLGNLFNQLQLEFVDLGNEATLQSGKLRRTPFSPDWLRIPLSQFYGTLSATQQGRLDLVYYPWGKQPVRIPLALFLPNLDICDVDLTLNQNGQWRLTWQEEAPLKNRRVLLRPAWQPWVPVKEFKIPDDARGELEICDDGLTMTRYQVLFFIAPSWESPLERFPVGSEPIRVDPCSPLDRLNVLSTVEGSADNLYCGALERACILHDFKRAKERDLALEECKQYLNRLTSLDLLTGLIDWMESKQVNPALRSYVWRYMFKPNLVKAAFQRFQPGHPLLRTYLSYTIHAPNLYADSAFEIAYKADDPAVVYACMRHLLNHESDLLILLVLDMIRDARLSEKDAVEILQEKAVWALPLLNNDPSDTAGCLMAGLLPRLPPGLEISPETMIDWMLRAAPFVDGADTRERYLDMIIKSGRPESYQVLMKSVRSGNLSERLTLKLLCIHPQQAYALLSNAPTSEAHTAWLERLTERHPGLTGVVRLGNHLLLPIGLGKIIRIQDGTGRITLQAPLTDPCLRITLEMYENVDVTQALLDLEEHTITFTEKNNIWKCGYCDFYHPEQHAVGRHLNDIHPSENQVYCNRPATFYIQTENLTITP